MKTKLLLATLLLASSAFGAGFVRFGVGVGPRFGYGYRGGYLWRRPYCGSRRYGGPYYAPPWRRTTVMDTARMDTRLLIRRTASAIGTAAIATRPGYGYPR